MDIELEKIPGAAEAWPRGVETLTLAPGFEGRLFSKEEACPFERDDEEIDTPEGEETEETNELSEEMVSSKGIA